MKRHEFKMIVLGVHNTNKVMLDMFTAKVYRDWETKTAEEQQTILERRLKSKSVRTKCWKLPENDYRNIFRVEQIVPGEIKCVYVDTKNGEN